MKRTAETDTWGTPVPGTAGSLLANAPAEVEVTGISVTDSYEILIWAASSVGPADGIGDLSYNITFTY